LKTATNESGYGRYPNDAASISLFGHLPGGGLARVECTIEVDADCRGKEVVI
jgi:hypothetical protein